MSTFAAQYSVLHRKAEDMIAVSLSKIVKNSSRRMRI